MKLKVLYTVFIACAVVTSCKKGTGPDEGKTASELVAEGWQLYALRNYFNALDRFNEAIGKDANLVDAYSGAGWTNAKLNFLNGAALNFNGGLEKDSSNPDIKGGLAIVYNAQKDYSESNDLALQVIEANPTWSFSHERTIGVSDLRLIVAQNYYALADYNSALQQVQVLNAAFTADVLTVAGKAALAQEIERLRTVV